MHTRAARMQPGDVLDDVDALLERMERLRLVAGNLFHNCAYRELGVVRALADAGAEPTLARAPGTTGRDAGCAAPGRPAAVEIKSALLSERAQRAGALRVRNADGVWLFGKAVHAARLDAVLRYDAFAFGLFTRTSARPAVVYYVHGRAAVAAVHALVRRLRDAKTAARPESARGRGFDDVRFGQEELFAALALPAPAAERLRGVDVVLAGARYSAAQVADLFAAGAAGRAAPLPFRRA